MSALHRAAKRCELAAGALKTTSYYVTNLGDLTISSRFRLLADIILGPDDESLTGVMRDSPRLAAAYDEGLRAGMDAGLGVAERLTGIRPDWPEVPSNPYRTEE